jgi:gamma-glutamylaminecyclotransferase
MHRVFVYGSLQRGEANHRMMADARFIARAHTRPAFDLFDLGSFPAMATNGRTAISGELYDLDDQVLERLDVFEGCPRLYQREFVALADGTHAEAYVMLRRVVGHAPRIAHGSWLRWRKGRGR